MFRYETNIKPTNVETGAKPKLAQNSISLALQTLISQEDDCIYHSDEDIPLGFVSLCSLPSGADKTTGGTTNEMAEETTVGLE